MILCSVQGERKLNMWIVPSGTGLTMSRVSPDWEAMSEENPDVPDEVMSEKMPGDRDEYH